jgi:hypothetical protein
MHLLGSWNSCGEGETETEAWVVPCVVLISVRFVPTLDDNVVDECCRPNTFLTSLSTVSLVPTLLELLELPNAAKYL